MFWSLLGSLCLALIISAWRKETACHAHVTCAHGYPFLGLNLCGVGVDFVHFFAGEKTILAALPAIFEDGGEMIFVSFTLAYSIGTIGSDHIRD